MPKIANILADGATSFGDAVGKHLHSNSLRRRRGRASTKAASTRRVARIAAKTASGTAMTFLSSRFPALLRVCSVLCGTTTAAATTPAHRHD